MSKLTNETHLKSSRAKEMFEELGYRLLDNIKSTIPRKSWNYQEGYITYFHYDFRYIIKFSIKTKRYTIIHFGCGDDTDREHKIGLQTHKAIHQQLKELGWLDD